MPIYRYHCLECDKEFEVVESLRNHEDVEHECPGCGSTNLERILEPFFAKTKKKS